MSLRALTYTVVVTIGLISGLAGIAYAQPVGGSGGGNDAASEGQTKPSSDQPPKATPSIQDLLQSIASAIEAGNNKPQTAEERDNAERDLAAQEDMAKWAKFMLLIGVAEIFVTLIGIFLIWRTLIHTRDAAVHAGAAVDEAKKATKAAEEAIVVTREMGEAQTRAYLTITSATISYQSDFTAMVHLTIRNTGMSPAYNVIVVSRATNSAIVVTTPSEFFDDRSVAAHPLSEMVGAQMEPPPFFFAIPKDSVFNTEGAKVPASPPPIIGLVEVILEYQSVFDLKTGKIDRSAAFSLLPTGAAKEIHNNVQKRGTSQHRMNIVSIFNGGWIADYRQAAGDKDHRKKEDAKREQAGE